MGGRSDVAPDACTTELLDELSEGDGVAEAATVADLRERYARACESDSTSAIVDFFVALLAAKRQWGVGAGALGISREELAALCGTHARTDEHGVTVGGRVLRALEIVRKANERVNDYLQTHRTEAPSGIELWDRIQENQDRIRRALRMSDEDWSSFAGQMKYAIGDVATLAKCVRLPADAVRDIARVTETYRMRLTPYYASLIMPDRTNDPVLLQSVPTGEMVDNVGVEIPPVASDHSPARLIDQFYPRVIAVKATNVCAMYCTHCLRIAHIGKKDRAFPKEAYEEALAYVRGNERIRDILVTGGDAFMLPNRTIRWLLGELDQIEHVAVKRLGTRVPVTTPQRVDAELLDLLEESNERSPLRVVTQINTAQEITPVSKEAFKQISRRVSAVLNQAVLLRHVNDTRTKMWKLCETIQEAYVRPYYVFNCSYRNPQFAHMRVPIRVGRDIVESMYGNVSGDAIPRYIAAAGGKVPLHRDNVVRFGQGEVTLCKPWSGEEVVYPDADPEAYGRDEAFAFKKYRR